MVDAMQKWLHDGKSSKAQRMGGADEAPVMLEKRYNIPVLEAREISREFREHDLDNSGHISRDEFHKIIRERTNLPEDEEIPEHLVKPVRKFQPQVTFEEFLKWSALTAWTEEMMQPCPNERHIRQLAREQEMTLPDVEKVKELFNEFDTD